MLLVKRPSRKWSLLTSAVCLWLLATGAPNAYCWDRYAHIVTTQIAYDMLTPAARDRVNELIGELNKDPCVTSLAPDITGYNAVTAGAWMDDLKARNRQFNTWHYIDLPINPSTTAADVVSFNDNRPAGSENAYDIIVSKCLPTLRSSNASKADKARMLAFLMHLVEDLHQPLHACGLLAGGNQYPIDEMPVFDPTWRITNLHAFWDNAYRYDAVGGTVVLQWPLLDFPRPAPDVGPSKVYADYLVARYLPENRAMLNDVNPADWAAESNRIASTFVFPKGNIRTLSPEYVHRAHDIACTRLALAGYRLGMLLNQLFDTPRK